MALADYFARNALSASQVLQGFDESAFRAILERVKVGVSIGSDAANSSEGRAILDLLIRLLARLYPTLVVRAETGARDYAESAMELARRINPAVEFSEEPTVELVIGGHCPKEGVGASIYLGSDGWNGFLSLLGPQPVGRSENPFGGGVAACLGAANLFRWVFLDKGADLDREATFSALDGEARKGPDAALIGLLGDVVLVGAGAIGNAAVWALSRLPMKGSIWIVDHQNVDLGNLQRYVLAERSDEGRMKVEVLGPHFKGSVLAKLHPQDLAGFVASNGHAWEHMLLALDSARDRRAAQASLPRWVANAWTQPGDLGVSSHNFLDGACVTCLYLPDHAVESEDVVYASALGVPVALQQIRELLHNGKGVPRALLEAIGQALELPMDRLLPFEGRPIRSLYTEGFCGGAVIPLGGVGRPRQDVHVPLAHQSALAGVLLAAALVRRVLRRDSSPTRVSRLDLQHPLPEFVTQLAAKDPRGICICQDPDFQEVYSRKYEDLPRSGAGDKVI